MTVEALNLSKRLAHLSDGRTVSITNLFDRLGEETEDLAEASSFVCGADRQWWSGQLSDFDGKLH